MNGAKYQAARELLEASKRDLQVVELAIEEISKGRIPVVPADDVSTEHRIAWLGAVDDLDKRDGINIGALNVASSYGFNNVKTGTIYNQEYGAFVCTDILVAVATAPSATAPLFSNGFMEDEIARVTSGGGLNVGAALMPMLRLTDGSSGRALVEGNNAQLPGGSGTGMGGALESGFDPFSAIGAFRPGLGAVYKNRLFAEFTLPRKATVKVEVVNAGVSVNTPPADIGRVCVSLLGYMVYGAG